MAKKENFKEVVEDKEIELKVKAEKVSDQHLQQMQQTVNTVNSPNINQPAAPMQPSPPTQPSFGGEIPGSNTMPGQINPNLPIQPSVPQPSGPQPFELTQLDLNADGMLNEQELLNSITSTQNPEIYNILNNLISQMGGNLSGGVSMDELLQAYLSPQAPEFTGGGGMGGQLARDYRRSIKHTKSIKSIRKIKCHINQDI